MRSRAPKQASKDSQLWVLSKRWRRGMEQGAKRRETWHFLDIFWDSEIVICVWLLVYALLSLAALLIPDFGDVRSLLHLFPCQLSSHYLHYPLTIKPFQVTVSEKGNPYVRNRHCSRSYLVWFQSGFKKHGLSLHKQHCICVLYVKKSPRLETE